MSNWGQCLCQLSTDNTILTITGGECKFGGTDKELQSILTDTVKSTITKVIFNGPIMFNINSDHSFKGFFSGMTKLELVEGLSFVDTTNLNDLSDLFKNCSCLTWVDVSELKLSNVSNISGMFSGCSKLFNINGLKYFDTSKVSNMSNLFNGCKSIRKLDLSSFDVSHVTDATDIIKDCDRLIEFKSPSGIIPNVFISGFGTDRWAKTESGLEYNSEKFKQFDTTTNKIESNTTYVKNRSNVWGTLDNGCDYEYTDSDTILILYGGVGKTTKQTNTESNTQSESETNETTYVSPFSKKSTVKKIIIQDILSFESSASLQNLFKDFTALTEVEGMNLIEGSNVTDITSMFENDSKLVEVDLSGFSNTTLTVKDCLKGCSSLILVTLPANIDDSLGVSSGKWRPVDSSISWTDMTQTDSKFTTTEIKTFNLKLAHPLANNATAWNNYTINNGTLCIPEQTVDFDVSSSAWADEADKITSVRILGPITGTISRLESMFEGLNKITSVYGLEYIITASIQSVANMFKDCTKLKILDLSEVTFSDTVKLTNFIDGCKNIQLILPKTMSDKLKTSFADMMNSSNWMTISNSTPKKLEKGDIVKGRRYIIEGSTDYWGKCPYFIEETHTNNVSTVTLHVLGGEAIGVTETNGSEEGSKVYTSPLDEYKTTLTKIIFEGHITFPASTNFTNLFKDFSNLSEIVNLDYIDTSNVTNMTSMFEGCGKLKLVNLRYFNTTNVTSFDNMFKGCSEIHQLDLSSFTMSDNTTCATMLNGLTKLHRIVMPKNITTNFDTVFKSIMSDTDKYKMEIGCVRLFNLKANVKLYPCMAYVKQQTVDTWGDTSTSTNCVYWKEDDTLYISNGQGATTAETDSDGNVTGYASPFDAYKDVSKIVLLGEIGFKSSVTLQYLFNGFSNLVEIENMHHLDISNVTDLYHMFQGCRRLSKIDMSVFNTGHAIRLMNEHYGNPDLTATSINLFNTSKITTMENMFNGCNALESIDTSKFVISQSLSSTKNMFNGCKNLKTLDLSSFNLSDTTTVEAMFSECTGLVKVVMPKNITSNLNTVLVNSMKGNWKNTTTSDETFKEFTTTSGNETQLVSGTTYIKENTTNVWGSTTNKKNCIFWTEGDGLHISNGIAGASIPSWNDDIKSNTTKIIIEGPITFPTDTKLTSLFKDFTQVTEIVGLDYIDTTNVTSLESMFEGCGKLTTIDISKLKLDKCTTTFNMFKNCSKLKSINTTGLNIPSTLGKMDSMFENCRKLKSIDLKSFSLSASTTIDDMFKDCKSLSQIDLSTFDATVITTTSIISGCDNLKRIITSNIVPVNEVIKRDLSEKWKKDDGDSEFTDISSITTLDKLTSYVKQIDNKWGDTTNKECVYWTEDTTLYISGGIAKTINVSISSTAEYVSPFNQFRYIVEKIVITGKIKFTGDTELNKLFANFTRLKEVVGLFNFDCSYDDNGQTKQYSVDVSEMFSNCCLLTHIDLSMFNSTATTITKFDVGSNMAYLETIRIPTLASNVTPTLTGFNNITSTKIYTTLDANSVTYYAWGSCVYDIDANSILTIREGYGEETTKKGTPAVYETPFDNSVKGAKSIVITGPIKFSGEVALGGLFKEFSSLTHIEGLEYIDFSNVTDIEEMFSGCSALLSINFSKSNFKSNVICTKVIEGCTKLVKFNTPSVMSTDLNAAVVPILAGSSGDEWKNQSLTTNTFTAFIGSGTSITQLTASTSYVKQSSSVWGDTTAKDNCVYWDEGTELHISGGKAAASIPSWSNKTTTTKIIIEAPITFPESSTLASLFNGFSALTEVVGLEYFNLTNISSINNMFDGCSSLVSFDWRPLKLHNNITCESIFDNCSKLIKVRTPDYMSTKINAVLQSLPGNWKDTIDPNGAFTAASSTTFSAPTTYIKQDSTNKWGSTTNKECTYWVENNELHISNGIAGASIPTWNATDKAVTKIIIEGPIIFDSGSLASLFKDFTNLTEVVGSKYLLTENVTDVTSIFESNAKLTKIDISGLNTSKATIVKMFNGCTSLDIISGMWLKNSTAKDFTSMFEGCTALQSFNIKPLVPDRATVLTNMFKNCIQIKHLDLYNYSQYTGETSTVTDAITGCESLIQIVTPLIIPNAALNTQILDIFGKNEWKNSKSSDTFAQITDAAKINPGIIYVKQGSTKHWGDTSTKKNCVWSVEKYNKTVVLYISGGVAKDFDSNMFNEIKDEVTKVVITGPITFNSLSSLRELFYQFTNLRYIEGLDYIDFINVNDLSCTFASTKQRYIDLSKVNTGNVTSLESLVADNSRLRYINFKNVKTDNVKSMDKAFSGCKRLRELDLSSFDTPCLTNADLMINNCGSMNKLDLSTLDLSDVTIAINFIAECPNLFYIKTSKSMSKTVSDSIISFFSSDWKAISTTDTNVFGTLTSISASTVYINSKILTNNWGKSDEKKHCVYWTEGTKLFISNGIADGTFTFLTNLKDTITETNILGKIEFSENTTLDNLFKDFDKLTKINGLNYIDTAEVTSMNNMFNGCKLLTELDLRGFNFNKLNYTESTEVGLTNFITGCTGLYMIRLPKAEYLKYKSSTTLKDLPLKFITDLICVDTTNNPWSLADGSIIVAGTPTAETKEANLKPEAIAFSSTYPITINGCNVYFEDNTLNICSGEMTIEGKTKFNMSDNSDDIKTINILGSVTLENNTSTSNDNYKFNDLHNLTTITGLDKLDVTKLTILEGMFESCYKLTEVNMSKWSFDALSDGAKDTDGKLISIFTNTFTNCYALTSFSMPIKVKEKDTNDDYPVLFKTGLLESLGGTTWVKDNTSTKIDATTLDFSTSAEFKCTIQYDTKSNLNNIAYYEFSDNNKTLYVTGGVANGTSDTDSIFSDFPSGSSKTDVVKVKFLHRLTFQNKDNTSVSLESLFSGFSALKEIIGFAKVDVSKVNNLNNMCNGCSKLEYLNMITFDTTKVTTNTDIFKDCINLKTILTPKIISATLNISIINYFTGSTWYSNTLEKFSSTVRTSMIYNKNVAFDGQLLFRPVDTTFIASTFNTILDYVRIKNDIDNLDEDDVINTTSNSSTSTSNVTSLLIEISDYTGISIFKDYKLIQTIKHIYGIKNIIVNTTDLSELFKGYTKIESIDFSDLDLSKVTTMAKIFDECINLKYLNMNGLILTSLGDVTDMFNNMVRLTTPNDITTIASALTTTDWKQIDSTEAIASFKGNTTYVKPTDTNQWNSVIYSNIDSVLRLSAGQGKSTGTVKADKSIEYTSPFDSIKNKVTKIIIEGDITFTPGDLLGELFKDFTVLTEVVGLNKLQTVDVTDISSMFMNCKNLTTINLKGFNTVNVTNMSNLFNGAGLKIIDLTTFNTVSTFNDSDVDDMFDNCSDLTILHTPKITMSEIFENYLQKQFNKWLDSSNETVVEMMYNTWYHHPDNIDNSGIFNNNKLYVKFTDFDLTDNSNSESLDTSNDWKQYSTTLETIDLRSKTTTKTTSLANLFKDCVNVRDIKLSKIDTLDVISFESMFENCVKLEHVDITKLSNIDLNQTEQEFKLSVVKNMFNGCSNIKYLNLSGINMSIVTNCENILKDCSPEVLYVPVDPSETVQKTIGGLTGYTYDNRALSETNIASNVPYHKTTIKNSQKWNSNDNDNCKCYDIDDLVHLVTYEKVTYTDKQPAWKTAYKNILHSVSLDQISPSSTTKVDCSSLFEDCLQLVNVENLKQLMYKVEIDANNKATYTPHVSNIANMFKNCKTLENIELPIIEAPVTQAETNDEASILITPTSIESMFENCYMVRKLDLSSISITDDTESSKILSKGNGIIPNLFKIKTPSFKKDSATINNNKFDAYFEELFSSWYNTSSNQQRSEEDVTAPTTTYQLINNIWGTYNFAIESIDGIMTLTVQGDKTANTPNSYGDTSKFDTSTFESNVVWAAMANRIEQVIFNGYIGFDVISDIMVEGLFANMINLSKIDFGTSFNFTHVNSIKYLLYKCNSLTSIDFTNVIIPSGVMCDSMFAKDNGDNVIDSLETVTTCTFGNYTTDIYNAFKKLFINSTDSTKNWTDKETNKQLASTDMIKSTHTYIRYQVKWNECGWYIEDGVLVITGGIHPNGSTYKGISYKNPILPYPWYNSRDKITKIIFEQPITFDEGTTLKEWFNGYSNLTTIIGLDNVDVSNVVDFTNAFYGTQLTRFYIGNWRMNENVITTNMLPTKTVTTRGFRFGLFKREAESNSQIILIHTPKIISPKFKSYLLTYFNGKLYDKHNKLTNNIKPFSYYYTAELLTDFNGAKYDVVELKDKSELIIVISEGTINNFDTPTKDKVKFIDIQADITFPDNCSNIFSGYTKLVNVDLTNVNTSNVTNASNMFNNCPELLVIDFKNTNMGNVTEATDMINNCPKLELIYTPKSMSLTLSNYLTQYLKSNYSSYNSQAITSVETHHWYHLKTIKETESTTLIGFKEYVLSNRSCLIQYIEKSVNDIDIYLSQILEYKNKQLHEIIIREPTIFTSESTSISSMFKDFKWLQLVDLTGFKTWYVTNMSNLFDGCISLVYVDVSGFVTSALTDTTNMFNGCQSLQQIKFNKC